MITNKRFAKSRSGDLVANLFFNPVTDECIACHYYEAATWLLEVHECINDEWQKLEEPLVMTHLDNFSRQMVNKIIDNFIQGIYLLGEDDQLPLGRTAAELLEDSYGYGCKHTMYSKKDFFIKKYRMLRKKQ